MIDATSEFSVFSDEHFMREALKQAQMAFDDGEVPIGAVVVLNKRIIGRGHNQVERLQDATAHAEMLALTAAAQYIGNKYLEDCTLYVTIEPCPMCAGASNWSKVGRIVYGAGEPKFGFSRYSTELLHPKTELVDGLLEDDCRQLMTDFFRSKRK